MPIELNAIGTNSAHWLRPGQRHHTNIAAPAVSDEESSQTTEDQIGLDKGRRRDVQRRLTGLGFDTKQTGEFDDQTRAVITRWQAARGYPKSGFFNKLQHKALLAEIVAGAPTAAREAPVEKLARPARASAGNAAAAPPPQRGPDPGGAAFVGGLMGGVVGGMLRR